MGQSKKTDNGLLESKLALRRHFLKKYHADQRPYVLDCCAGSGVIWSELRGEGFGFDYWAVDQKPKKGRLKIDSVRILQQPGWPQNVIDCDLYGSPWRHWFALLPNVIQPITVFLTIGLKGTMARCMSDEESAAIGITSLVDVAPRQLLSKLCGLATLYCIAAASRHGLKVVEAAEATRSPGARYVGVRLEPLATK